MLQHTWSRSPNLPGESTAAELAPWPRGIRATLIAALAAGLGAGHPRDRSATNVVAEICGAIRRRAWSKWRSASSAERVIYGSDFSGRSFASQLAKVYGANVPEEAKALILAGNIKRILAPILTAKGIAS